MKSEAQVRLGPQSFTSVRPRRAVDEIVGQIRDRIQAQELVPGDKLPSERDLAEQMGVSRNTVREALRMLEVSGLLTLKKGATGGAFVTESNSGAVTQSIVDSFSLGHYTLSDLLAVRLVLETLIIEQACLQATDKEVDAAAAIAQQSVLAERSFPDFERRLDLHMEFHRALARCGHNPVAAVLLEPLLAIMRQFHLSAGPVGNAQIHQLRLQLVEALRARDAAAAVEAFSAHIMLLGAELEKRIS